MAPNLNSNHLSDELTSHQRFVRFLVMCFGMVCLSLGWSNLSYQKSVLEAALTTGPGYAHISDSSQFLAIGFPVLLLALVLNWKGLQNQQHNQATSVKALRFASAIVPFMVVTVWLTTQQMHWLANWAAPTTAQGIEMKPVVCDITVHGQGKGRWRSFLYAADASLCHKARLDPQAPKAF